MNFSHIEHPTCTVITLYGIGEYGDDIKLIKYIEKYLPNYSKTIAINFSHIDTINSAAVAALINCVKYCDENSIDIVFIGTNEKIDLVIERAMPRLFLKTLTIDEFNKKYNITP